MPSFHYRHSSLSFTFSTPSRFSEGRPLTSGEADALNLLLMERARENCRVLFTQALARQTDPTAISDVLAELQQQIHDYAMSYEFTAKPQQQKLSSEEREALQIARNYLPDGASPAAIEAEAAKPYVRQEARERLQLRAHAAAGAIQELL